MVFATCVNTFASGSKSSADPAPFLVPPSAKEVSDFGGAIRFGYQVADELLGRVMAMVDDDTVVLVASGLSQQPYVTDEFPDGRSVLRIRDIDQVVDLLGAAAHCRAYAVMATQWNLDFDDAQSLQAASRAIAGATVGAQAHELFAHTIVGNTISINIRQKLPRPIDGDADCVFPATGRSVKMRELCADARLAVQPLGSQLLDALAAVFAWRGRPPCDR